VPVAASGRWTLAVALVFIVALAVNLLTAAPTVLEGDGGELQTVALIGGVAHPSGYPTFVLLGRLFGALLPGEPAFRATAMCAVFGAAALATLLIVMRRLGLGLPAALVAVVLFGASFTCRWISIRTEVYSLALLLYAWVLAAVARLDEHGRARDTLLPAVLLGVLVTAHQAFSPAALAIGAYLALRPRLALRARARHGLALLGAFALGLSPYLYSAWVDRSGHPMNYLRLVIELDAGQFGLTPSSFDAPWERIPWLIRGSEYAPRLLLNQPRQLLSNGLDALGDQILFELGPLGVALAVFGMLGMFRSHRRLSWLGAGIMGASAAFTLVVTRDRLIPVFLLPLTALVGVAAGAGVQRLLDAVPARRLAWVAVAAVPLVVAACLLPHALRLRAQRTPDAAPGWRPLMESGPPIRTLWPRLDGYREPREYGEAAMARIPHGAFVLGRWSEIMVLYYLQRVEGRRRDLTLDPFYHPWHLLRVARWQERHDLARRPIVLLYRLEPHLDRPDSVHVQGGRWLYIQRRPLRNVEAWKASPEQQPPAPATSGGGISRSASRPRSAARPAPARAR
jgi:transmembrane protein TMEM260 (protein O-mannosyltransferase)